MDEEPANYAGLHDRPSDGMSAYGGAKQIKGPGGGTGDGIDDGAELDEDGSCSGDDPSVSPEAHRTGTLRLLA